MNGSDAPKEWGGIIASDSFPIGCNPQDEPVASVCHAIARTRDWLLSQQREDGHWVAELEGDTILESETVLLLAFLGRENSDLPPGWPGILWRSSFPRAAGPCIPAESADISGSVKAYFALKLDGPRAERRSPCSGLGGRFLPTAARMRSTVTPAISWQCSDRSPTINVRSSRRRSCCCPNGSP